jgi:hypothetical protein
MGVVETTKGFLKHFARKICQTRALATGKCDVAAVGPALEAVHGKRQTGGAFSEVGRVNLCQIAHADDFCTWPCPGNERLHLFRCEVLGFIDDDVLV